MDTTSVSVERSEPWLEGALAYMTACVERRQIAGAVALVTRRQEVVQLACVGSQDIDGDRPMQPDTIFRIASMTKPMVSVGALMLVEAGRLRLDDPVSRFIPEFAHSVVFNGVENGRVVLVPPERPITVRDLLTHTSGLGDDPPHPMLASAYDDLGDYHYPISELMRRLAARPLAHQPGTAWIYGWSHDVLGRVVEVVADRPLDDYLGKAIFGPLGMVDTGSYVGPDKVDRLAVAYQQVPGGLRPSQEPAADDATDPGSMVSGGGGFVSTVLDYGRFVHMLERRGELDGVRVLTPETVAQMTSNRIPTRLIPIGVNDYVFEREGYGLGVGVFVEPAAAGSPSSVGTYMWNGWWGTTFYVDPVRQLSCVFMTQYEPCAYSLEGAAYWSLVCGAMTD